MCSNFICIQEGSRNWEKTLLSATAYRNQKMRSNPKPHQNKLLLYTDVREKKKEMQLLIAEIFVRICSDIRGCDISREQKMTVVKKQTDIK